MQTMTITSSRILTSPDLFARIVRVCAATLVVAAAAHIAFPLPFTPVPFTLQPLAVLGVGLTLGPLEGALAMVAYLLEGACGFPVFSPTGSGGLLQLLGPTGGYLLSYPLVAAVAGLATIKKRRQASSYVSALLACSLATALLFLAGAGWLAHLAHLGIHQAWSAGIAPFLPGEAVKILAAAGGYRALHRPTDN